MGELFKALFGVFLIGLPFAFAAALSRELAKERGDTKLGWKLFAFTSVLLILNVFWGISGYLESVAERKWTAATFALAAIVPRSVPIVGLCWILKTRLRRPRGDDPH